MQQQGAPLYNELAHRSSDGLDVSLIWRRGDDSVAVVASDTRSGTSFAVEIDRCDALDAFYHPYAYAASRGVVFDGVNRGALERSRP